MLKSGVFGIIGVVLFLFFPFFQGSNYTSAISVYLRHPTDVGLLTLMFNSSLLYLWFIHKKYFWIALPFAISNMIFVFSLWIAMLSVFQHNPDEDMSISVSVYLLLFVYLLLVAPFILKERG